MTGEDAGRILVVGAGAGGEALVTALARYGVPTDQIADAGALPAGLVADAALVIEAAPDSDAERKSRALRTLLDGLPGRVPIAVATRIHTLEALLPASRHGARVVGLHLVGGQPAVAEVAMPAQFDDLVVDAVLALLEGRGLVALPCGDAPGRVVDRMVAVAWLEARAAIASGVAPAAVDAALAGAGLALSTLGPDQEAAARIAAIHAGLGEPDRFDATIGRPRAARRPDATPPDAPTLEDRLVLAVIAEGYRLVEEAVAGAEEIERALTAGAGWAAGPFTLAGRRGLRAVVTALAAIGRDPAEDPAARDRFAMPRVLWTMATV